MSIETFLKVGERTEFSKTIGEADLILFSGLTGDFDPIHVNEDFARTTAFESASRMAASSWDCSRPRRR
jgi:acyl dehydratase